MLDSIDFSVISVKDKNFRYYYCNDAFCVLLGLPRENIIGKTFPEVFLQKNPHLYYFMFDDIRAVYEGKNTVQTTHMRDANDILRWFKVRKIPAYNKQKNIIGVYSECYQITNAQDRHYRFIKLIFNLLSYQQKEILLLLSDIDLNKKEALRRLGVTGQHFDTQKKRIKEKLSIETDEEFDEFICDIRRIFNGDSGIIKT